MGKVLASSFDLDVIFALQQDELVSFLNKELATLEVCSEPIVMHAEISDGNAVDLYVSWLFPCGITNLFLNILS